MFNAGLTASQDYALVGAVERNLAESRHFRFVDEVISKIAKSHRVYFWGGAVRDPIVRAVYGKRNIQETSDFDLLVDDSGGKIDIRGMVGDLYEVHYNRFGTIKLTPAPGLAIDISSFSNSTRLLNGEKLSVSLENTLSGCDFTTSALAYGFDDRTIHSYGALEGIRAQEIELLYPWETPHSLMCKLVLQSDRLGFAIGKNARKFIAENYGQDTAEKIRAYLDYKNIAGRQQFVIESLVKIKNQPLRS